MVQANYKQRLRLEFSKGGSARFISHLDLSRTLERSLNRAAFPLAYTQGFNPRPRMQFADALPLGFTSSHEIADFWLTEPVEPESVQAVLEQKMAPGITLNKLYEVSLFTPALQTITRMAEYHVELLEPMSIQTAVTEIRSIMESETIMQERKGKSYNVRSLIYDLAVIDLEKGIIGLKMLLYLRPEGTGRPDEVLKILHVDPLSTKIHRTQIVLSDPSSIDQK